MYPRDSTTALASRTPVRLDEGGSLFAKFGLPRWPFTQRVTDLPFMAERVHDSPKPPAMFILNRRDVQSAGLDGRRHDGFGIVDEQQSSAGSASMFVRAEALHRWIGSRHPERGIINGELNDDVVAIPDSVEHLRAECPS